MIIAIMSMLVLLAVAAEEAPETNSFVELPGLVGLPLPAGWRVVGAPEAFPVAVVEDASGARLLIFQTVLAEEERIAGAADFHVSVNRVIDSVVLQMPDVVLLTSRGNYTQNRAEFAVEFQTLDTISGEAIYHRLSGLLYRHPEGPQLLFSLWAQVSQAAYGGLRKHLEVMQSGFRYGGPQEEYVFAAAPSNMRWFTVALIGGAAVMMMLRQRRRYLDSRPGAAVWKCGCGRVNDASHEACRKCGQRRERVTVG